MKQILTAFRIYLFMSLFLGLGYTFSMTAISQILFYDKANGSVIQNGEKIIGSWLIGQKFESPKYFWTRPSAIDYNPLPSGGTNLSGTQEALRKAYSERAEKLKIAHGPAEVPEILLSASASGLDPDISHSAAAYQVERIAKARGVSSDKVHEVLQKHLKSRQFGFLGEPTVNVVELNLALDGGMQ